MAFGKTNAQFENRQETEDLIACRPLVTLTPRPGRRGARPTVLNGIAERRPVTDHADMTDQEPAGTWERGCLGGDVAGGMEPSNGAPAPARMRIAMERRVESVIPLCGLGSYVVASAAFPFLFGTPRKKMSDAMKNAATVINAVRYATPVPKRGSS